MSASPAQFAELSRFFRKDGANAIVAYVESQIALMRSDVSAAQGNIGVLGSNQANAFIATYPVRSLDTDFVISPSRSAIAKYTMSLAAPSSIIGNSLVAAQAELMINGQTVQTVLYALSATLILGLSLYPLFYKVLSAVVPAGATVNLRTAIQGAGSQVLLLSSQETLLW